MLDFWFQNAAKLIYGPGEIQYIEPEISRFGSRVFWIHGDSSLKISGYYDIIATQIGTPVAGRYSLVGGETTLANARHAVQLASAANPEVILAVGGGSVLDLAKIVAASVAEKKDPKGYIFGTNPVNALPIVAVPTVPASGSEMNHGAVLIDENGDKRGTGAPCLIPKVAILDPNLAVGLSAKDLMACMADVYAHASESFFNGEDHQGDVLLDEVAAGLFRGIIMVANDLHVNPADTMTLGRAMLVSVMAQNLYPSIGRGKRVAEIHHIANAVSAVTNMPHKYVIGMAEFAWNHLRREKKAARMAWLGSRMTGRMMTAVEYVSWFSRWIERLQLPLSIHACGFEQEDKKALWKKLDEIGKAGGWREYQPKDADLLTAILWDCSM